MTEGTRSARIDKNVSDPVSPYTTLRVCVNFRAGEILPSCAARGSKELEAALRKGIADRRIPLKLDTVHCMGKCHIGPTMQLLPHGPYIMGATMADVPDILDLLQAGDFDTLAARFPLPAEEDAR